MLTKELDRVYLPTSTKPTENVPLQRPEEVHFAPFIGKNSQLEGTGFHLGKELLRLESNYNQNLQAGKELEEAWEISVSELEVNLRTYIVEYIQTRTILPHLNRLEKVDGKVRMVGRNGALVVSAITTSERAGSVLQASQQAENYLTLEGLEVSKNQVAVINSPLGHSGLINEQGKLINYKNNQTLVFWTDKDGKLHGLTIVSDLNQDQSRKLSIALGVDEEVLDGKTEAERVANIVKNPALFSYGQAIANPAKYVLEKIIAIRGSSDLRLEQEDGSVEIRSVVQTTKDIEKVEDLLKFSPDWERCLQKLRLKILSKGSELDNPFIQSEIARAVEETILEITIDYLEKTQPQKFNVPTSNVIYFQSFSPDSKYVKPNMQEVGKYAIAAAFLRTRSGCAGGGGGSSRASLRGSSLGSTSSVVSGGRAELGGICNECGGFSGDNHYHCPDCNSKYGDETNLAPENRTKSCGCGFVFECGNSGNIEEKQKEGTKIISFPTQASGEIAKAA